MLALRILSNLIFISGTLFVDWNPTQPLNLTEATPLGVRPCCPVFCINQVVKVALRICSAIAGLDD